METVWHYKRLKREHPTMPALELWRWAKHEHEVDGLEERTEWAEAAADPRYGTPWTVGRLEGLEGFELVTWWDDEPYDWGDLEPTDDERENLHVIVAAWRWAGGENRDTVCGIGYDTRTSYGLREALRFALDDGWIAGATRELEARAGYLEALEAAGGDFR